LPRAGRLGDDVVAQALAASQGMRHRLDACGVDRPHALDHREDVAQLRQRALGLGIGDVDACEVGDAADLVEIESHQVGKRGRADVA
jgi:hypothetical protein